MNGEKKIGFSLDIRYGPRVFGDEHFFIPAHPQR